MEQVFFSTQVGGTIKCAGGTAARMTTAREVCSLLNHLLPIFLSTCSFLATLRDMQITLRRLGIATDESNGILYCTTSSMVSFGELVTNRKSRYQPKTEEISRSCEGKVYVNAFSLPFKQ